MPKAKSKSKRRVSYSLLTSTARKANGFIRKEEGLVGRIEAIKAEIDQSENNGSSSSDFGVRVKKNRLALLEGELNRVISNRSKVEARLATFLAKNKSLDDNNKN